MEGHEGSWVHDTHAYPLLPQHGYALLAGLSMMYNGRGVSPLKLVPPTSSSGCTPYFPFGFVPPTSPSGFTPYFSFGLCCKTTGDLPLIEMHAWGSGFH